MLTWLVMQFAEQAAEDVKAHPELVEATATVLSYSPETRPFLAVHSGEPMQVRAWIASQDMLDHPQNINMQMDRYNYTAFSLACEAEHCEIVEILLKAKVDTAITNHIGMTGRDIHSQCRIEELTTQDQQAVEHVRDALDTLKEVSGKRVWVDMLMAEQCTDGFDENEVITIQTPSAQRGR